MASNSIQVAQGQTATLTAQFVTTPAGMPIDVPDATVQVLGPGGAEILPQTSMTNVMTGFYFFDWIVPNTLPVGTYTARYRGTVLGVVTVATQTINVLPAGVPTGLTVSQRQVELITALESYVGCAQKIPVYMELARRNSSRDTFQFTWPRWNLSNHLIKVNNEIVDNGFNINTDTGTIKFDKPLKATDSVHATYNFAFFSQIDMLRFLNDALSQINLEPPGTTFSLDSVPNTHVGVLMLGASKNAIRNLIFCLNFQEPSTIFGGKDGAKDAISNFNSLKENNEKEFERDKKQIKKAQYPRTTAVVQPEFTLPGGRCLHPATRSLYRIYGNVIELSIEELFDFLLEDQKHKVHNGVGLYKHVSSQYGICVSIDSLELSHMSNVCNSGQKHKIYNGLDLDKHVSSQDGIYVLSDFGDKLDFARISNVWNSGLKVGYKMHTRDGRFITTSDEHLFFVDGILKPLRDISVGDTLSCLSGGMLVEDEVISITEDSKIEMYDIEIPETENLIANEIKCHNSRWFRYLFSTNVS